LPDNTVTNNFYKRLHEEKKQAVPVAALAAAHTMEDVCGEEIDIIMEDSDEAEEEDNNDDNNDGDVSKKKKKAIQSHQSPFLAVWLIPIICGTITSKPQLMLPYGHDFAITNTLLNSAWSQGKDAVFFLASTNCKYVLALHEELVKHRAYINVMFYTPEQAIN
jgi:hypothetical protein